MTKPTPADIAALIQANLDRLYAGAIPTSDAEWDDYRQVQAIAWDYAYDRGLAFHDRVLDLLCLALPRTRWINDQRLS